jgi:hypothetical protein
MTVPASDAFSTIVSFIYTAFSAAWPAFYSTTFLASLAASTVASLISVAFYTAASLTSTAFSAAWPAFYSTTFLASLAASTVASFTSAALSATLSAALLTYFFASLAA